MGQTSGYAGQVSNVYKITVRTLSICYFFSVSGEANFSLQRTGMTLGGFIQPGISRAIVEQPANVEKGLCQRFLWLVPQPCFDQFDQLQRVDEGFISSIGKDILFCIDVYAHRKLEYHV